MNFERVYSKYNVLPKLERLSSQVFLSKNRLQEKTEVAKQQQVFFENNPDKSFYGVALSYMYEQKMMPRTSLNGVEEFVHVMSNYIYEDVVIHRANSTGDWVSAMHVSFPNGWEPEEQIGKGYEYIHRNVPGMNLANSRKLVDTCINEGPFQRYVWGVFFDNRNNHHPRLGKSHFDLDKPEFYVKIETQITVPFPVYGHFLFVLRQDYLKEDVVNKTTLYETLSSMSPEHRKYKNITDEFLDYLRR